MLRFSGSSRYSKIEFEIFLTSDAIVASFELGVKPLINLMMMMVMCKFRILLPPDQVSSVKEFGNGFFTSILWEFSQIRQN